VEWEGGVSLRVARQGIDTAVQLAGRFDTILWPGGDRLVLRGPEGVAYVNETTGAVERTFGVPVGWSTKWVWTRLELPSNGSGGQFLLEPHLLAFGPQGGSGILFRDTGGPAPIAEVFDLPAGFARTTVAADTPAALHNGSTFAGLSANGTFVRASIDLGTSPPQSAPAPSATVLVVRESAQSVFGQLTSLPVAVTIGIFALMAGAFGPAALAGLTDVAQEDKRGTTMGLYSVVISSSMIVGPVVTGFLVDNYGGFGVMVFLASSAAAMALFMGLRAWDVRRAGGEHALREKTKALQESAAAEPAVPGGNDEPAPGGQAPDGEAPDERA